MMYMDTSVILFLIFASCCDADKPTFRAAVYEHAVVLPDVRPTNMSVSRAAALQLMMKNLEIYRTQTETAAREVVNIIVFPEDGIYGMKFHTRTDLTPYLEYIPDPNKESWNACAEPNRYANTEVQHYLSCLAKYNSLYLVANFGDKQPCSKQEFPSCPGDGHFQFNTDVVYDPEGILIAKYHKKNLFYEFQFDFPPTTEVVTFNTPFGLFGIFTCFDILFHDPAIDLINRGIRNIVFPTAWVDALPLLAAVQFHSAFARGLGLNFLAANINHPEKGYHGSGIYSPDGVLAYYYNDREQRGQLLMADVPVLSTSVQHENGFPMTISQNPSWPLLPSLEIHMLFIGKRDTSTFKSLVFHDLFTFKLLDDSSVNGLVSVCQNSLCCRLDYQRNTHTDDVYAFGVFDGFHTYQGKYYIQVCTLLRCQGSQRMSCGTPTTTASSYFHKIEITGNFSSPYVYPEVLVSWGGSIAVPLKETWTYRSGTMMAEAGFQDPLISAGMFGRVYTKFDSNGHETV